MAKQRRMLSAALMTLFGRNWITLFGGTLAGVSGLLIAGFLILGALELADSPYIGIMAFLVLPFVFVFGLLIVPVGVLWEVYLAHRRAARGEAAKEAQRGVFPVVDFNNVHTRHVAAVVVLLTVINLVIVSTASYEGVVYMDSVPFCGETCHTVMQPEYSTYKQSPHFRVKCIECHIGPGAPWFVKSKLSGLGQVIAVTFDTYPRPIPSPVENLRPSRDTCEQCHWPQKFAGDRLKVLTEFKDDEANTATKSVLLMHVGGGSSGGKGIHSWHIDPDKRTVYWAVDKQRQQIAKVRVERSDGSVRELQAPKDKYPAEAVAAAEEREMDCIDCHNRPTHIFKMPAQAVDEAMAAGRIDRELPYIKKLAVEALTGVHGEQGDLERIEKQVRDFYKERYPDRAASDQPRIDAAIQEIKAIYTRNIFPEMNVTWGVHPNNIGHDQSPGCFRCHDDVLVDKDNKTIGQDCEACHAVLAWGETNPDILKTLGIQQ
jgi:nitrate/TMAO reductase-like tetraheme cytochrome c subunit